MDVTAWLSKKDADLAVLFRAEKPHGSVKRLLGRLLNTANAGARYFHGCQEEFYGLKRRLLERYGTPCGTDWQEIIRECFGCEACGQNYSRDAACDGRGVFDRKYIPLARTRLGRHVFHTPGPRQSQKPDAPIAYKGLVPHRQVDTAQAFRAYAILALLFEPRLIAGPVHELITRVNVPF